MKTLTSLTIATVLTSSLVLPFTANAEESNVSSADVIVTPENNFSSYVVDGIEINSDVPLNEAELNTLYKNATNPNPQISLFQNDIGSNAITVVPAKKITYSNSEVKLAADIATAYLGTKIPVKLTKVAAFNYYFSKFTGLSSSIKPTYVETYVVRTWSEYDQMYLFKATVAHYTDSTYKKVKSVSYREINRSKTKTLSGVNGYK